MNMNISISKFKFVSSPGFQQYFFSRNNHEASYYTVSVQGSLSKILIIKFAAYWY